MSQGKNGIRDYKVTGVQTCALPILELVEFDDDRLAERAEHDRVFRPRRDVTDAELEGAEYRVRANVPPDLARIVDALEIDEQPDVEIGRASCRERGERWSVDVSRKKRHTRLQGDWSSDVCSSDLRACGV